MPLLRLCHTFKVCLPVSTSEFVYIEFYVPVNIMWETLRLSVCNFTRHKILETHYENMSV